MALIICKDCTKTFSTDAKRCPHCGAKKPIKQWNLGKMLLWIVGLIFLGAILDVHMKTMIPPPPPPTAAEVQKEKERTLEIDIGYYCQGWIKKSLHDPDSAEFDNPNSYHVTNKNGDYTVEVTLRAKNVFNALRKTRMQCRVLAGKDRKVLPIELKEVGY